MATLLDRPAVPTVSLADEARDPEAFAQALGGSFERFGFAIVADHHIDQGLIDRAWAQTRDYFAQEYETKLRDKVPAGGGQRGYTPFGIEIAKDAKDVDLKEFFHVGRELPPGHPFRDHMGDNVWPAEPAGFRETMIELYAALDDVGGDPAALPVLLPVPEGRGGEEPLCTCPQLSS